MTNREGETAATHLRTTRYYCISGQWFFSTRENLQVGPFQSQDDAQVQLMLFLRHLGEGGIYAQQQAAGSLV